MKVFIVKMDSEDFITVKSIYVSLERMEETRQHIKNMTGADHVWFEVENPPLEVLLKIQGEAIEELRRADPGGGTQEDGKEAE